MASHDDTRILHYVWKYEVTVDDTGPMMFPYDRTESIRIEEHYQNFKTAVPDGTALPFPLNEEKKDREIFLSQYGHYQLDQHGIRSKMERCTEFESRIKSVELDYGIGYIEAPSHVARPIIFSCRDIQFGSNLLRNDNAVGLKVSFQINPDTLMAVNIQHPLAGVSSFDIFSGIPPKTKANKKSPKRVGGAVASKKGKSGKSAKKKRAWKSATDSMFPMNAMMDHAPPMAMKGSYKDRLRRAQYKMTPLQAHTVLTHSPLPRAVTNNKRHRTSLHIHTLSF